MLLSGPLSLSRMTSKELALVPLTVRERVYSHSG
jgi:hypothetical protein